MRRFLLILLAASALGQITLTPVRCLPNETPSASELVLDAGYAQFDQGQLQVGQKGNGIDYGTRPTLWGATGPIFGRGNILRFVLTGRTQSQQQGFSNITNFLAALVVESDILTFSIGTNSSALCSAVRSPTSSGKTGCPFGPGDVALGVSIPLEDSYPLATINSRISVLDSSVPPIPLACYDLSVTPYYPTYFPYLVIHYFPVFLIAGFATLYFLARLYGSYTDYVHESETQLASSLTLKLSGGTSELGFREKVGTMWYASWAGKQLIGSGSLRRFCSPELREVWNAIAWWTIVGLVAVQYPDFAYPIFSQYAWTTLVYNSTFPFVVNRPVNIIPPSFVPPPLYATQMQDRQSPLFLDSAVPNVLLNYGPSRNGIEKWSRTIGIDSGDVWGICTATFVIIVAVLVLVTLLIFAIDAAFDIAKPKQPSFASRVHPLQSTKNSSNFTGKESSYFSNGSTPMEDEHPSDGFIDVHGANGNAQSSPPSWLLHLSLLQGNLVRLLLLFHLPLSIFAIYQFSLYRTASRSTLALAAIFFAIVCVALPAFLFYRIHVLSRRQLFLDLPTLLALGPLYNGYSEECTMFSSQRFVANLLFAVVIGGVQSNGTAQAAVILFVEIADALITSLYLPWAENSSMGPFAFLLSLSRIIVAVCMIVLSPAVGVSRAAASWLAYAIFAVQGIVAVVLFLVLVFKLVELLVRSLGKVPFDESRSPRAGGLFGALGRMDRGAINKGRHRNSPSSKAAARRRLSNMTYGQSDGGNMDTFGSNSRMLNPSRSRNGHSHEASSISAMTYTDSASYPRHSPPGSSRAEGNDDFIMSAMSSGSWNAGNGGYGNTSAGYIHPAAYSTVPQPMSPRYHHTQQYQPQLHDRSGSFGSESALTPTRSIGSTSGFSRVGGGRASSDNPYQVQPEQSYADYPPIPTHTALPTMNTHNRHSQSAIVELGDSPEHYSIPLPATSQLLSNTTSTSRFSVDPLPHAPPQSASTKSKGVFGRWKSKKGEDVSSDDDDSGDEQQTSGVWSRLRRGKSSPSDIDELVEPPIDKNHKSEFVVVRKPRPKPSPASSSNTPKSTLSIALPSASPTPPSDSNFDGPIYDAPHLSIQPPSR